MRRIPWYPYSEHHFVHYGLPPRWTSWRGASRRAAWGRPAAMSHRDGQGELPMIGHRHLRQNQIQAEPARLRRIAVGATRAVQLAAAWSHFATSVPLMSVGPVGLSERPAGQNDGSRPVARGQRSTTRDRLPLCRAASAAHRCLATVDPDGGAVQQTTGAGADQFVRLRARRPPCGRPRGLAPSTKLRCRRSGWRW